MRVRLRELAEDTAPVRLPEVAGAAGSRRVAGEPQARVPAVRGGEAELRRKRGRRRAPAAARVVLAPPTEPDQVWTMDFTQDAFASGRRSER